jgi:mono/diheme cytochrome c family protein
MRSYPSRLLYRTSVSLILVVCYTACTAQNGPAPSNSFAGNAQSGQQQIALGRRLVLDHGCADCHSIGVPAPDAPGFLAGVANDTALNAFHVGPFITRPKNLTPDVATGTGSFTERQIFNALRYGLRPEETPDLEITSQTPGQGNFPAHPHYLAPPMPWIGFRHMSDEQLYAIAAYIKNGLKPVSHRVKDSDGPPDFWASTYAVKEIGPWPAAKYPTANETGR